MHNDSEMRDDVPACGPRPVTRPARARAGSLRARASGGGATVPGADLHPGPDARRVSGLLRDLGGSLLRGRPRRRRREAPKPSDHQGEQCRALRNFPSCDGLRVVICAGRGASKTCVGPPLSRSSTEGTLRRNGRADVTPPSNVGGHVGRRGQPGINAAVR